MTVVTMRSEHAPRDWEGFLWPPWVPTEVREQIESFWAKSSGRGPDKWLRGTVEDPYNNQPPLGEHVLARGLGPNGEWFEGAYVPAWNNIGRVIPMRNPWSTTTHHCVSTWGIMVAKSPCDEGTEWTPWPVSKEGSQGGGG